MQNEQAIKIDGKQKEEVMSYTLKNDETDIKAMIQNCAQSIAPVWPLETFIACNPLHGFESMPFEEAIICSDALLEKSGNNEPLKAVNLQTIKWCGAFLDAGQGTIHLPHRDKGFYFGFLKLAPMDNQLHQNQKSLKSWLLALPEKPELAIQQCLDELQVTKVQQEEFIKETLFYLPGWAGYIKWRSEWNNNKNSDDSPVNLIDFLAVRLVITRILWPDAAQKKKVKNDFLAKQVLQTLKSHENEYRNDLLHLLLPELKKLNNRTKRPDAQLIFCIDVRSEPFRRAIEQLGHYETFGFAGFFGLPIRVKNYHSGKIKDSCPVLLKPRFNIEEKPLPSSLKRVDDYQKIKSTYIALKAIYQQLKYNFSTPFALAESLGIWCGIAMLLKSITSYAHYTNLLSNVVNPMIETEPSCDVDEDDMHHKITLDEQIAYAEIILKLMGMTENFAKIIVFCGHGSTTQNNPYASALDCGACGGNHGGINARLLAKILNNSLVRQNLEEKGIHIPFDTVFFGAQHDTTTDLVKVYDSEKGQCKYPSLLNQLVNDLEKAKFKNHNERGQDLMGFNTPKTIERRSVDWSETRPEWGLARNAAFIIAPRVLTEKINLKGRCFLHSYRWDQDGDGSLLETILTAPMVVAQWINTQYLFSTLDNVKYGSGSKITHNIIGKIGVIQGNGSDLMHGLPLQSVMSDDKTAHHCPQRLLTIIYGKREVVKNIIAKQSVLKKLFFNDWVHLLVIEPGDNVPYQLSLNGDWKLAC